MPVVSNSSPLIALAAIEQLDLLFKIFSTIVIPPAVATEISRSIQTRPKWLRVQPLSESLPTAVLRPGLGIGEREAIGLALELRAEQIIVDDLPARRLARALGLTVVGTLGILLFFLSPELYQELLNLAGEHDS